MTAHIPEQIPPPVTASAYDVSSFERLVRIETQVSAMVTTKATEHADLAKDLADHETRIRALERAWWKAAAIAGLVAVPGSAIAAALAVKFVVQGGP